ncbi:proline iminopeptidase [Amycolatopsis arida]|uniref:Proline iminopeptidase n=1 Tax=Amycolatopsis arida TaxID=587909 RepID=A0A1I5ZF76_9PSEU|nr:prolyl aminopeptidase [Amycolatopsis arida]TDX89610.1 proline iminopeptidase [Amycolatopsis arida]SFQ55053.1 proline iminopeptidase [Amycolatopsis arida]
MRELYPETEPYDHGMLDVGDGNRVHWEVHGNPAGRPAVVLHGGPGTGCTPGMCRYFDPDAYRVVLFDQRGSGRSTPHASDPSANLAVNTTHHLLADMERLREHLGIDRWLLFGGSWGSTLGLAYAQRHPRRVTGIVLVAVTTTRQEEIDWLYHGLGRLFPEEWERFRAGVPAAERNGDLVAAYHRLLNDPDPAVREQAARACCDWELAASTLDPHDQPGPQWADPAWRMAFARLTAHYFSHGAWLEDGELLRGAGKLAGIPGVMVHGRLDLSAPLITAWEVARAWPGGELVIVPGAGHSIRDRAMTEATLAATEQFAA